jgi:hypothetical protein
MTDTSAFPQYGGAPAGSGWPGEIEHWRAANGDLAQITWQPDDPTLDKEYPPTSETSSGKSYYIQHGRNGLVEIIMYGGGNAVLYSVADPNVSPNNVGKNGILVTDLPNDQTLLSQAEQLLEAS